MSEKLHQEVDQQQQLTQLAVENKIEHKIEQVMIEVTAKAVAEIKRIQTQEAHAAAALLRIMVVGGGCSGMSYKLGFEEKPLASQDKVFEKEGVRLVIDSKSYLYLAGTVLDFSDGLNGTGFVFNNPNAKRTCGCGSSFSA